MSGSKAATEPDFLSSPTTSPLASAASSYPSAAQRATAPTIANALALAARSTVAAGGGHLIAAGIQPLEPPHTALTAAAPSGVEAYAAADHSALPGFAATPARRGFIVALSPLVAPGIQPSGPPPAPVGPILQPAQVAATGQDATAIFGLPEAPRTFGAPSLVAAVAKKEMASLADEAGQFPLNTAPAAKPETARSGLNRAAGGAALKPIGSLGVKLADASAVGPAANTASGKSVSELNPCDQACEQSQPVPVPDGEAVGLTPDLPSPAKAAAGAPDAATTGAAADDSWGSSLSRFWSSSLAKLGFGDQSQPASADPAPEAAVAESAPAAASEPRQRKTLPQGPALSRAGPEYDGKPNGVAAGVLPVAEGIAAPKFSGEARIEQVSTGPRKDGHAGEPLSPTIAVNTVELSDLQAVQQPDLSFAEARFDAGASPIAPFGATPAGYDIRGFMMEVLPKTNEAGMSDCAVSLSQARNGSFSVTSLAGSAKVALGADEATASTDDKQPAAKPRKKNQKDAAPVVPPGSRPIQAVIVLSQGNKPFLQVDFPGGGEGGFPPPWSCRYWLEITPPNCKLAVVSHRAKIAGSQSILETNSAGKCQLAKINSQDVH